MSDEQNFVSIKAWDRVVQEFDERLKTLESKSIKKGTSYVSLKAWDRVIQDFENNFKKINERLSEEGDYVSIKAWDRVVLEFSERLSKLESRGSDDFVSVNAWNRVIRDFDNRFKYIANKLIDPSRFASINDLNRVIRSFDLRFANFEKQLSDVKSSIKYDELFEELKASISELRNRVSMVSEELNRLRSKLSGVDSFLKSSLVAESEIRKLIEDDL